MPRKPRAEEAGAAYHVSARGNGGRSIFVDDFDRLYWLQLLARAVNEYEWDCYAYCLLDTHYHLLVETPSANLGDGMRLIQTRFAQRFNRRHASSGHVFGDRYHSKRIESEGHLVATVVYVALNPVRAGLTTDPASWRWSSHRAMAGLENAPGFLAVGALLERLSGDRNHAREIYRAMVEQAWGLSPHGDSPPLLPLSTPPAA